MGGRVCELNVWRGVPGKGLELAGQWLPGDLPGASQLAVNGAGGVCRAAADGRMEILVLDLGDERAVITQVNTDHGFRIESITYEVEPGDRVPAHLLIPDGVSADDVALVESVEHVTIEEAHVEEQALEEALEKEHDEEDLEKLKAQLGE